MNKQTAVDWLVEQLIPKAFAIYDITTCNAIKQAKEMEKDQICNAYTDGLEGPYIGAGEYYKKTKTNKL